MPNFFLFSKSKNFNPLRRLIAKIFLGFKNIPYKFMFVLILLSLWLGEWYPISNFPMYSGFGYSQSFIYITDGQDRPIPLGTEFGLHASAVNKVYRKKLKNLIIQKNTKPHSNIEIKAGEELLQYLQYIVTERNRKVTNYTNYQHLKLWKIIVTIKDDQIVQKHKLITELQSS